MSYMDAWKAMQRQNPKKWGSDWGQAWVNACQPEPVQPFQVVEQGVPMRLSYEEAARRIQRLDKQDGERRRRRRYFRWAKRALKVARFVGCEVHA